MAGRRGGGADRALFDHSPYILPIVWPSVGVTAGHLQCLGTQLWVGRPQKAGCEFRFKVQVWT